MTSTTKQIYVFIDQNALITARKILKEEGKK